MSLIRRGNRKDEGMSQSTTRKRTGRLLAMAAGAAIAVSASSAMAAFQYQLRFTDDTTTKAATAGSTYVVNMWAQITDPTHNWVSDSPSTDAFSIVSGGGNAIASGGITKLSLDSLWSNPPQTQVGTSANISNDGVTDWGGTGTDPTVGYSRYLSKNTTNGGFRASPPDDPDNGVVSPNTPPVAGKSQPVAGNANAWEWKVATFTVSVTSVGSGSTTFLPVSGTFTGQNASYNLSYFQNQDLSDQNSGAIVSKGSLAPLGVTFTGGAQIGPQLTDAGPADGSGFGTPKTATPPNTTDVKVDKTLSPAALGTELKILNSSNTTATVTVKFRHRTAAETPPNSALPNDPRSLGLISDVADVSGLTDGTDKYVVWETYDPNSMVLKGLTEAIVAAAGDIHIDSQDASGNWVNTVKLDHSGTPTFVGVRPYDAATDGLTVGEWGVDIANHAAWAIVDHASTFAVVPEPATLGLLGLASLGLLARKRNRKA
jgi:hypothetical protein